MTLEAILPKQLLRDPSGLYPVIRELQGFRSTLIAGAAAGTKMNIASMRLEDTILSAIQFITAGGAPVDDKANITIQPTKAYGTLTISGNPVALDTFEVNGVTYTWNGVNGAAKSIPITAGNVTAMAEAVVAKVNAWERSHKNAVVASNVAGVVTFTSVDDGVGNGPIVTDTGSTITVSSTDPGAVTATFVSAAQDDALTVNGVVFTLKDTPTLLLQHADVKGTDALQAVEMARVINAYEARYHTLNVIASVAANVVTLRSIVRRSGNSITLTENASNCAVSGAGYLANGTNTGGIKSTTDLSLSTLLVTWFDKAD